MRTKPTNPRPTSAHITRYRTAALVGNGINFNPGASAQFNVTMVIRAVFLVRAEEPICSPMATTWPVCHDQLDDRQLYRRVVVPAAELLREGLPEPEV